MVRCSTAPMALLVNNQPAPPPFHMHRPPNGTVGNGPLLQGMQPRGGAYNAAPPPPPPPMPQSNSNTTPSLGPTKTTPLPFRAASLPSDHSHNQTMARCLTFLDSAMRTGALFAKTRTPSMYHDAMTSLQSILDLLQQFYPLPTPNAASAQQLFQSLLLPSSSAPNTVPSGSLDDGCNERTNAVREIRIAVHVTATMLHLHRGTQQEAIPHISRVLDLAPA